MLSFVLSGGANFGALQAGALQVLLQQGWRPEMAVGTSAGALNAIFLASDPTVEGMERLAQRWREAGSIRIGLPTLLNGVRRWLTHQPGLIPSSALAEFLDVVFPAGVETFGALRALHGMRAYAVAVAMESGEPVAFGDRDQDRLIDGAMASTAVPPFFAPWRVDGVRYLDGGVRYKLPLQVALERGATRIIALDVANTMGSLAQAQDLAGITGYAMTLMVEQQTALEIEAARQRGVGLYVLRLVPPEDVRLWDYTQAERLVAEGRRQALEALGARPIRLRPSVGLQLQVRWHRLLRRQPDLQRGERERRK